MENKKSEVFYQKAMEAEDGSVEQQRLISMYADIAETERKENETNIDKVAKTNATAQSWVQITLSVIGVTAAAVLTNHWETIGVYPTSEIGKTMIRNLVSPIGRIFRR